MVFLEGSSLLRLVNQGRTFFFFKGEIPVNWPFFLQTKRESHPLRRTSKQEEKNPEAFIFHQLKELLTYYRKQETMVPLHICATPPDG